MHRHPGDPCPRGNPLLLTSGKAEWPARLLLSWFRRHSTGMSCVNDTFFGPNKVTQCNSSRIDLLNPFCGTIRVRKHSRFCKGFARDKAVAENAETLRRGLAARAARAEASACHAALV
jgi:hypothetical protein